MEFKGQKLTEENLETMLYQACRFLTVDQIKSIHPRSLTLDTEEEFIYIGGLEFYLNKLLEDYSRVSQDYRSHPSTLVGFTLHLHLSFISKEINMLGYEVVE